MPTRRYIGGSETGDVTRGGDGGSNESNCSSGGATVGGGELCAGSVYATLRAARSAVDSQERDIYSSQQLLEKTLRDGAELDDCIARFDFHSRDVLEKGFVDTDLSRLNVEACILKNRAKAAPAVLRDSAQETISLHAKPPPALLKVALRQGLRHEQLQDVFDAFGHDAALTAAHLERLRLTAAAERRRQSEAAAPPESMNIYAAGQASWPSRMQSAALRVPAHILRALKMQECVTLSLLHQDPWPLLPADAKAIASLASRQVAGAEGALVSLNLRGNAIGSDGLTSLARALPSCALHTLDVSSNTVCGVSESDVRERRSLWSFNPAAVVELMDTLPEATLTELDLSHNCIAPPPRHKNHDTTHKDMICTSPATTPTAHTAGLKEVEEEERDALVAVRAVCSALRRAAGEGCSLKILSLAGNWLGDAGATLLAHALRTRHCRNLKSLDLSATALLQHRHDSSPSASHPNGEGLRCFLRAVAGSSIVTLTLRRNNLGGVTMPSSGAGSEYSPRCIGELVAVSLFNERCTQLTCLDLCDNEFSSADLEALALETLNLGVSKFTLSLGQKAEIFQYEGESSSVARRFLRDVSSNVANLPSLHYVCSRKPAARHCTAWVRHLIDNECSLLTSLDDQSRSALDVARSLHRVEHVALLEAAITTRTAYRGRYILTAERTLQNDGIECQTAVDKRSGLRIVLRFFVSQSLRVRWQREVEAMRRVATYVFSTDGRRRRVDGVPLRQVLIANMVDAFVSVEGRATVAVEACNGTLRELQKRRQCHDHWARIGLPIEEATAPRVRPCDLEAAQLSIVRFTREEIIEIARDILEALFWLHFKCGMVHGNVSLETVQQFRDGWRLSECGNCVAGHPLPLHEKGLNDDSGKRTTKDEQYGSYDVWHLGRLLLELMLGYNTIKRDLGRGGGTDEDAASVSASLRAVHTTEPNAANFLSLLLHPEPTCRPTVEQLLGRGGGRRRPHAFVLSAKLDDCLEHGWLSPSNIERLCD